MRRILLGAVLLILACEGAATLPAPSQSAAPRGAAAPTATIDVSDMMGAFPQTQFLVVTDDSVKSVALLNHAFRYSISIAGAAQVTAGNAQVYIADETADGTRLRWIDKVSGATLATWTEANRKLAYTGTGNGALVVDPDSGQVLALFADGPRRIVEAFEPYTLRPTGRRLEASCGDRLLVAAGRIAIACFEGTLVLAGTLVLRDAGDTRVVDSGLGPYIAAAMRADGTILVGRSDGTLAQIRPAALVVERIEPFRPGQLVPDGIAAIDANSFAIALGTSDHAIGISELRSGRRYVSFEAKSIPTGGLVALDQFAYWVDGAQLRHVDLQQGFSETMATLSGSRVRPGAVSGY